MRCLVTLIVVAASCPLDAHAFDLTLVWTPNTETDLAGYRLFCRKEGRTYDHGRPMWEGTDATCTIDGLDPDTTYYFVVRAFDTSGLESGNSNQVSFRTPVKVDSPPAALDQSLTEDEDDIPYENDSSILDSDGDDHSGDAEANDHDDPADSESTPFSEGKVMAGLGTHPSDGGWIELFGPDYAGEFWLQVGWSEYNAANGEARLAAGDIDGDGKDEVIIGLGPVPANPFVPAGLFQVFDHDYTLLTWGQVESPEYNQANGETWPACGDLDGDGDDEVIVGLGEGGDGRVEVFDYISRGLTHMTWATIAWEEYNAASGQARPACGDIDGDGKDEIIIGLAPVPWNPLIPAGFFEVLDDNLGHLAWGRIERPDYNNANGETRPACGDLDGDGDDEIVVGLGLSGNGRFEIFDYVSDQIVHRAWKEVHGEEYQFTCEEIRPVCGNLDEDAQDEILVGMGPGGGGWIQVFDDGTAGYGLVESFRILADDYNAKNGESWPAIKSQGVKGKEPSACLGDLDFDGDVDGSDSGIFRQDYGREDCSGDCPGDLDEDGDVDDADMGLFAADFGRRDCE